MYGIVSMGKVLHEIKKKNKKMRKNKTNVRKRK